MTRWEIQTVTPNGKWATVAPEGETEQICSSVQFTPCFKRETAELIVRAVNEYFDRNPE